ncbi:MAG: hypothetical protein ABI765_00250 [Gemmatimonadota bacterium]
MSQLSGVGGLGFSLALGLVIAGCGATAVWQQNPNPAQNLPNRFSIDPDRPPATGSKGCPVRLLDERDGTRLVLIRSVAVPPLSGGDMALGDYRIEPEGHYGLGPQELLRVQCPSRRPQGAVR